jgi:hypothetical protein
LNENIQKAQCLDNFDLNLEVMELNLISSLPISSYIKFEYMQHEDENVHAFLEFWKIDLTMKEVTFFWGFTL